MGKVSLLAVGAGLFLFSASLLAQSSSQVQITQQSGAVVVKTATDTLRLTVCSPTSIHVVASPDGNAAGATPQQPWLTKECVPAKFSLNVPSARTAQSEHDQLWNPAVATLDTGALKVRITLAWGTLEFQDEQGNPLLQEFQDAPRRYVENTVNGESL